MVAKQKDERPDPERDSRSRAVQEALDDAYRESGLPMGDLRDPVDDLLGAARTVGKGLPGPLHKRVKAAEALAKHVQKAIEEA